MILSNLKNLVLKKDLLWSFATTDLKLRYKNSILGVLWSFLEPLLMLSVLYSVFTYLFQTQIEFYALYLLIGIIAWNFFSRGTNTGMQSIIARGGLVTSIYFPRLILPISANITSFLMMLFELSIFVVFLVIFQFLPGYTIFLLPLVFGLLFLLTAGLSSILSVLYIRYRDIGYIWQVIIHAGFFATPIIYKMDIFPEEFREIVMLNPMAQIIEFLHDIVIYNKLPAIYDIMYTVIICIGIFFVGIIIFTKMDKTITDHI